jgi:hypothetical protein
VINIPEHLLGDVPDLVRRVRATNSAVDSMTSLLPSGDWGATGSVRISCDGFRWGCETRKDLSPVNTRGGTKRSLIPSASRTDGGPALHPFQFPIYFMWIECGEVFAVDAGPSSGVASSARAMSKASNTVRFKRRLRLKRGTASRNFSWHAMIVSQSD